MVPSLFCCCVRNCMYMPVIPYPLSIFLIFFCFSLSFLIRFVSVLLNTLCCSRVHPFPAALSPSTAIIKEGSLCVYFLQMASSWVELLAPATICMTWTDMIDRGLRTLWNDGCVYVLPEPPWLHNGVTKDTRKRVIILFGIQNARLRVSLVGEWSMCLVFECYVSTTRYNVLLPLH